MYVHYAVLLISMKQCSPLVWIFWLKGLHNSRGIKTEDKAKVIAAVWRTEFLATLAVLHWTIWIIGWFATGWFERNDEFILFFKIVLGKIASAARNFINQLCPPNKSDDLCLFFCFYPSSIDYINIQYPIRAHVTIVREKLCYSLMSPNYLKGQTHAKCNAFYHMRCPA